MKRTLPALIGVTGIVYGDIGTSPIYAFELSLKATGSHDAAAILGVLSLIFWALAISVTLKYVVVMMRLAPPDRACIGGHGSVFL